MNSSRNNISKMLSSYSASEPARFHMPGHKGKLNSNDITEISQTDNLNSPSSYILKAQEGLSACYNSYRSYFLVNGATSGIHAMIKYSSIVKKGKIIFGRNSHKAVINAAIMFGLDAIVIEDVFDDNLQVFRYNQQAYVDTINKYIDEISAVVLTSVDYYGRVINLDLIRSICHENNILLLVDEAHGSHLIASEMLPASQGHKADIWVHSPHKTLSAYTQGAYLHINKRINPDIMQYVLQSLQTSSPNYLLVESLEKSLTTLTNKSYMWDTTFYRTAELRKKIDNIPNIKVMDIDFAYSTGYSNKDITRLVIDVSEIGNGIVIGKLLEDNYNIYMEMSTFKYLVGILTPWDNPKWYDMLYDALENISKLNKSIAAIPPMPMQYGQFELNCDISKSPFERIPLSDCCGRTAAMPIGIYPPGVAMVLPGEKITNQVLEYLLLVKKMGGELFGTYLDYVYCIIK